MRPRESQPSARCASVRQYLLLSQFTEHNHKPLAYRAHKAEIIMHIPFTCIYLDPSMNIIKYQYGNPPLSAEV
jgi:hypothetical protein